MQNEVEQGLETTITEPSLDHGSFYNLIEPEASVDDCKINLVKGNEIENDLDAYRIFLSNLSINCDEESVHDFDYESDEEFYEELRDESDELSSIENEMDEGEDEDGIELSEGFNLKNALRAWKTEFFITQAATTKLLLILSEAGHTDLPKNARSFSNITLLDSQKLIIALQANIFITA